MIFLVRHTCPDVEKGICYGQTNLDVAATFDQELLKVKAKFNSLENMKVISSPLKRCIKLAENLFPNNDIVEVPEIMELNFGAWEMKRWDELDQDILKNWGNNFITTSPPEGEKFIQLFDRVRIFWQNLAHENENYAIVTHDGVIRSILSILLDIPLKKAFSFEISYGAVIQLNFFDAENCRIKFL